jgi:hypothetical protein
MGPRNHVNEVLERQRTGAANYETEEDALLAALEELVDDARAGDMESHARGMRGEPMPPMEGEMPPPGEESMPQECMDGTCEHPEHQLEDALPEDI